MDPLPRPARVVPMGFAHRALLPFVVGTSYFLTPLLGSAQGTRDETLWLAPIGVNLGAAAHRGAPTGALLGAEASLVGIRARGGNMFALPTAWGGAYLDGVFDPAATRGRFGIGPEIGYMVLGLDGGLVAQIGGGPIHLGGAVRPLLALGPLVAYTRFVFVPNDTVSRTTEFGVLLKWPIEARSAATGRVGPGSPAFERADTARLVRWWMVEGAGVEPRFVVELEGAPGLDVEAQLRALGPSGTIAEGKVNNVRLTPGRQIASGPLRRFEPGPATSYEITLSVMVDGRRHGIEYVTPGPDRTPNDRALSPPGREGLPAR